PALDAPGTASRLFLDHLALAFLTHVVGAYGAEHGVVAPVRGGLSPLHERRAKEMLLARLDGRIGVDELAAACGLSRSHFARAFKVSTGSSPLRWQHDRRIEKAKELLAGTAAPIADIAHACGFLDQSHLNRAFARTLGTTPGRWRKLRRL